MAKAKPRRRRGSTSPPLVGVESNPGPKAKASRKLAKMKTVDSNQPLSDKKKREIEHHLELGLSTAEISSKVGTTAKAVNRWKKRLEETGEMKTRHKTGRPPKRRPVKENSTPSEETFPQRKSKRRKQMSERDIGKVELGIELGLTERKIGNIVNRSHTTIQRCKKKLRAGQRIERKRDPGSGRPRNTTKRDDRHFALAVVRSRDVYAPQAALEVTDADGRPILAPRNVQTRLHEHDMVTRRKRKKPWMTEDHKKARRIWAEQHADWSKERWRHVLWSDESPFTLFTGPRGGKVWIKKTKKRLDPRQIEPTKKHGGGHINVWGCFSASGVGSLKWVEGKMDASSYHGILTHRVLPTLRTRSKEEPEIIWLFQHDNASVHTAEECTTYLKKREKAEGFKVLDWPSQSPDLNPIENVWSHLKLQLKHRKVYPRTKAQLWGYVQEEWAKLPANLLMNLAVSMPKRCKDVIAAHGGPIDY